MIRTRPKAVVSNVMMTTSQRDQNSKCSEGLFRVSVQSRNGLGVDDAKPMQRKTSAGIHPVVERLASTLPVDPHQSPHDTFVCPTSSDGLPCLCPCRYHQNFHLDQSLRRRHRSLLVAVVQVPDPRQTLDSARRNFGHHLPHPSSFA
jgi:hypothetical protein